MRDATRVEAFVPPRWGLMILLADNPGRRSQTRFALGWLVDGPLALCGERCGESVVHPSERRRGQTRGTTRGATQLRLREYHRTRPNEVFGAESLFLEMKDDSPDASVKERYLVPTAEVPSYLRGERTIEAPSNVLVGRIATLVTAGVRPVVVTQYNRIAHSAPDGSVRITADHNLMYLAIPWEANSDDVVPTRLGPVLSREPGVIIEVKWFDRLPHWADELYGYVREHMVNERPSKYVIAMQHLLGEAERPV